MCCIIFLSCGDNGNFSFSSKNSNASTPKDCSSGLKDFSHVLKTSIFISDMGNFAEINEVYGQYFDEATAPARETVEVANLPKYVNVEISMIASL